MRKSKTRNIIPRESETVGPVLRWLALQGARVHRRNAGMMEREYKGKSRWVRFADPGMCDYWFLLPDDSGRHVEMEWKRPGGWPRPNQIAWMLSINARGGVAFWARDLAGVQCVIAALLRGDRLVMYTTGQVELVTVEAMECLATNRRNLAAFCAATLADRRTGPALRKQIQALMSL